MTTVPRPGPRWRRPTSRMNGLPAARHRPGPDRGPPPAGRPLRAGRGEFDLPCVAPSCPRAYCRTQNQRNDIVPTNIRFPIGGGRTGRRNRLASVERLRRYWFSQGRSCQNQRRCDKRACPARYCNLFPITPHPRRDTVRQQRQSQAANEVNERSFHITYFSSSDENDRDFDFRECWRGDAGGGGFQVRWDNGAQVRRV
jgi:hypothetical protein